MVKVFINENKLILAAAFSQNYAGGNFEIPLKSIAGVGIDPTLARDWLRRREFLAEFVPSVKRSGVYYEDADCVYWEVKNPAKTIVIYLQNESPEKLIVEVDNQQRAVEIIENALKNNEPEEQGLEEEIKSED